MSEFQRYTPTPPLEIIKAIGSDAYNKFGWLPYPWQGYWGEEADLSYSDFRPSGAEFEGKLGSMDITIGCKERCPLVCAVDSPPVSLPIPTEVILEAINSDDWLKMPAYILRLGSTAEPADHPDLILIVKNLLERRGNSSYLEVYTNFRKSREKQVLDLLKLQQNEPELRICVSLPAEEEGIIHRQFEEFIDQNGLRKVVVNDLMGQTGEVEKRGRFVPDEKARQLGLMVVPEQYSYINRGKTGIFFNGKWWLVVEASRFEAHTSQIFAEITPNNIEEAEWLLKVIKERRIDRKHPDEALKEFKEKEARGEEKIPLRING
ncbi:MAG: hypothetical protein V1810_02265 [Candidatus Beckwithbacteria bacterium]